MCTRMRVYICVMYMLRAEAHDIKLLIKSALSIGFTRFSSMSCFLGVLLRVYSMFSHSPAPPPPAGSSDVQSKQHLFHWRQILPQMLCVFFRIECVLSLWECVLSIKCVLYIMCSLYTMYSAAIVTVLNMRGESVCILLYRMCSL